MFCRLQVLGIVTVALLSRAAGASDRSCPSHLLDHLYDVVLQPVLAEGNRLDQARIRRGQSGYEIRSADGTYVVNFTSDPKEVSPQQGLPRVSLPKGKPLGTITLLAPLDASAVDKMRGIVRSLIAPSPLHPHAARSRNEPPEPSTASYLQLDALSQLMDFEFATPGTPERGLVLPVGTGKTLVSAKYVRALQEFHAERKNPGWDLEPKVVFCVQNRKILRQALGTYKRELELSPAEQAGIYAHGPAGEEWPSGARLPLTPKMRMLAISRTGFSNRLDEIKEWIGAHPALIVFDEGEYAGDGGEFEKILEQLRNNSTPTNWRLLWQSATLSNNSLAHRSNLVRDILGGRVSVPLLNAEELKNFRDGKDLEKYIRIQFFRNTQQGYSSPLFGLHWITSIHGTSVDDLLRALDLEISDRKRRAWAAPLAQNLADTIRAVRVPHLKDRGLFFVRFRWQADLYAELLSEKLGCEVRAMHGGGSASSDAEDWLRDRGRYSSPRERAQHKYAFTVRVGGRGLDIPNTNLVVFLKKYSHDASGFRSFLQNFGRSVRISDRKPGVRAIDYTLYSRVLLDGLESISVTEAALGQNGENGPSRFSIDGMRVEPTQFQTHYENLFGDPLAFGVRFPYYERHTFIHGALRSLHELAHARGINFSEGFNGRETLRILAEALPHSEEKQDYLEQLDAEEGYGFYPRDTLGAKSGSDHKQADTQRYYEALFDLARVFKYTHPQGADFDLATVHTETGFDVLRDALLPEQPRSLLSPAEQREFLAAGGWELLGQQTESRHLPPLWKDFSLKALFLSMAEDLLPGAQAPFRTKVERLLSQLRDDRYWRWGAKDGNLSLQDRQAAAQNRVGARIRNSAAFQHGYRALDAIAILVNERAGKPVVDRRTLYSAAQVRTLLEELRPAQRGYHFDAQSVLRFSDLEHGAIRAFQEQVVAHLGIPSSKGYAVRKFVLFLAGKLEDSPERSALLKRLRSKDWGWTSKDGSMIANERFPKPSARFHRALFEIAVLLNQQSGAQIMDPRQLESFEGLSSLCDFLTLGFIPPAITPAQRQAFDAPAAGKSLRALAKVLKVRPFATDFGLKKLLIEFARALPAHPNRERLIESLNSDLVWGWVDSDGYTLQQGKHQAVAYRTQRALVAIAYLRQQLGDTGIQIGEIRAGRKLERLLPLGVTQ